MRRFNFTLEKILQYREQMEESHVRMFGKAVEVLRRRENELRRLMRELVEYRNHLAEMGLGRVSPRDLAFSRSYLTHCEAKVAEAADRMMAAARDMEEKKQGLVSARKERRIMEKLKEIKRRRWQYEAAREETKELDEVAATRHIAERAAAGGVI
ncbi:MAG: flagellar export protein FliJ [Planctomycetota bacterium]|jgi:flagellar FliJ protein